MCKDCLCVTCEIWEDCPIYAGCEQLEVPCREPRKMCSFYQSKEETEHENKV